MYNSNNLYTIHQTEVYKENRSKGKHWRFLSHIPIRWPSGIKLLNEHGKLKTKIILNDYHKWNSSGNYLFRIKKLLLVIVATEIFMV